MPPILEVKNLNVRFPIFGGLLLRRTGEVRAVDDVSFTLNQGETLGLVGSEKCLATLAQVAGNDRTTGVQIGDIGGQSSARRAAT